MCDGVCDGVCDVVCDGVCDGVCDVVYTHTVCVSQPLVVMSVFKNQQTGILPYKGIPSLQHNVTTYRPTQLMSTFLGSCVLGSVTLRKA